MKKSWPDRLESVACGVGKSHPGKISFACLTLEYLYRWSFETTRVPGQLITDHQSVQHLRRRQMSGAPNLFA